MKRISRDLDYLGIERHLLFIAEPNRTICLEILNDHRLAFQQAPGSTHNHQAWAGGYIDHVTDAMNYARHLFAFDAAFGRPMPFTLGDAMLVLFLHDIEKPWRIVMVGGAWVNRPGLTSKDHFRQFRDAKLKEYGIEFTPYQANGFAYVEGEQAAYSSKRRVMNELAAFCHKADVWSARGWYDYPAEHDDPWTGAKRVRTYDGGRP